MKYFAVTFDDGEKFGIPMTLIERLYPAILDCVDDEERKIFIQDKVQWMRVRHSAMVLSRPSNDYAHQFANNACEFIDRG